MPMEWNLNKYFVNALRHITYTKRLKWKVPLNKPGNSRLFTIQWEQILNSYPFRHGRRAFTLTTEYWHYQLTGLPVCKIIKDQILYREQISWPLKFFQIFSKNAYSEIKVTRQLDGFDKSTLGSVRISLIYLWSMEMYWQSPFHPWPI